MGIGQLGEEWPKPAVRWGLLRAFGADGLHTWGFAALKFHRHPTAPQWERCLNEETMAVLLLNLRS